MLSNRIKLTTMEIKKKYTAIQIYQKTVDSVVIPQFEYGKISGPYYNITEPKVLFDTEQEAIEWAYEEDEYSDWLILPIVSFKR